MSREALYDRLAESCDQMRSDGTWKQEWLIDSPQATEVALVGGRRVINMCANNYLGLASHPEVTAAARDAIERWGYGMASVRFICGTQQQHVQLEKQISQLVGQEATILYNSCWDANGGLYETILGPDDAIISDELNHASIIDGIRLCKAQRLRYRNNDMDDLREKLASCQDARTRLIATDGVFSMDGTLANLPQICELADEFDALVMVDDSHAVGFMGSKGGGTPEHFGVVERVDMVTGTLGKALGGASGGYTAGKGVLIDWLRQRSRTYLFSNSVAPPIVGATLRCLELLEEAPQLRGRLFSSTKLMRERLAEIGYDVIPGEHPIVPIMIGDAAEAARCAAAMLEKGIYVVGFSYPVVPKGKARIRLQLSAAHTDDQLDRVIAAFTEVRQ
jgi:glycine C-acetyltransferase